MELINELQRSSETYIDNCMTLRGITMVEFYMFKQCFRLHDVKLFSISQSNYNIKNDSTKAIPPKFHGDHKSDNQVLEGKIFGEMICQTPEMRNIQ